MRQLIRPAGAIVLVVLVGLMLSPRSSIGGSEIIWDKAAHFIAFGLILWSLGVLFRRLPRLAAAILAVAIGATIEVAQGYVGRDPSWGDLLADTLGVATALLTWLIWRGFRPREAHRVPDASRGEAPQVHVADTGT